MQRKFIWEQLRNDFLIWKATLGIFQVFGVFISQYITKKLPLQRNSVGSVCLLWTPPWKEGQKFLSHCSSEDEGLFPNQLQTACYTGGPATEFLLAVAVSSPAPTVGAVCQSSHSKVQQCQGLDVGALQGRLSLRHELQLTSQMMFFI